MWNHSTRRNQQKLKPKFVKHFSKKEKKRKQKWQKEENKVKQDNIKARSLPAAVRGKAKGPRGHGIERGSINNPKL